MRSILFRIVRICCSLFKSSYLKNKKNFLSFLFHLWNLHQILNNFIKKNIVIANVFPKLATVQGLVTPLTIQRRLKTSLTVNMLNGTKTSKSFMRALLPYFLITVRRYNLENISLIEVSIHRVFVNTWTADYKYPVLDCENLSFPIEIQFS